MCPLLEGTIVPMLQLEKLPNQKWALVQGIVATIYSFTHVLFLTALPVFADEAIYIRWSQLILDDAQRYAFFALNDGKTPLFIWLMIPFLKVFTDQLFAGRLISVIAGFFQIFVMKELVKQYGGKRFAQLISMLLVTVMPFWSFYHRMALMDSLMTLFLSVCLLLLHKLTQSIQLSPTKISKLQIHNTALLGLTFGLALWTKLPALFFGSIFAFSAIFPWKKQSLQILVKNIVFIGTAGALGCLIFLLLKLNPAFGQLFSRGRDFTYTIQELLQGDWVKSISNTRIFLTWFIYYFSPGLLILTMIGLYLKQLRKMTLFLIISFFLFLGPFILLGKVVYPRYLLPAVIFLTIVIGLVTEKALEQNKFVKMIAIIAVLTIFTWSSYFFSLSIFNADATPLVAIDREQYLTEWSSGHGVKEAVIFVQERAKTGKVLVATEGFFGTLPDGVLLYLHNQDVTNIEVWGIGAPVRQLPNNFEEKAAQFDQTYLLVNSHRMFITDPRFKKIESYPRPYQAPTFDIYQFMTQY